MKRRYMNEIFLGKKDYWNIYCKLFSKYSDTRYDFVDIRVFFYLSLTISILSAIFSRARWFNLIFQKNISFGFFADTLPKLEEWNSFWQLSVSFRSPTNPPWEVTFYAWEYKGFSKFIKGKKSKQRFWFHYFTTFFWAKIKSSGDITGAQTVLSFFSLHKFWKSFVFLGLKGHLPGRVGGGSTSQRKLPKTISFFQFW